jgi:UDP-N-acetylglucosamine:LPS N-acetylglucosamine transferase
MRRLREAFTGFDVAYVTTQPDYVADVPGHRFYAVADITRKSPGNIFILVPQLARILLKERPDAVVTTGSAPGLITLALAKALTRARTMWIDSIANCERLSSSGARARFFADEWLTQWPELSKPEGPRHWGAVL